MATAVTLDDVRAALEREAIDPRHTNASAIRALVGDRGSLKTIQRHLDALRTERMQADELPAEPVATPPVPAGLADALWRAAWDAMQAVSGHHTARLVERIAALEVEASTAAADRAAALEEADGLAQTLAETQQELDARTRECGQLVTALNETRVRLAQTEDLNARLGERHAQELAELRQQLSSAR